MLSVLEKFKQRNIVHDISHEEELEKLLAHSSVSFYCGFDPTADSLHVGSMLPLIIMRRLQQAGHKPIAVIGSATGMIGDPSGKSEERKLLSEDSIQSNIKGIEKQIKLFLGNDFLLKRNDEWLKELSFVDFLRDIGKHFSVNAMMIKDSVKARLENREQGISFTEFSYMLLQAYDFYWLNKNHNCQLQIGGSDQWGNITAGLELIRKKKESEDAQAFGFTFPLLTTSSGTKFGKTEEGAVWLDANKTSPYKFYQYWLNTADADVIRYLELFTEVDDKELDSLTTAVKNQPQHREAQKKLASELTILVHGQKETDAAIQASSVLFGGSLENIDSKTLSDIFSDVPSVSITKQDINIIDLLITSGLAKSKSEARRSIEAGGIYVNNERCNDLDTNITSKHFIDQQVLVLRSGKKNYRLVKIS